MSQSLQRINWFSRALVGRALLGLLFFSTARADEPTIQASTTAGQEVLVRTHQEFTQGCQPKGTPRAIVIAQPAHGHLDIRQGVFENHGTTLGSAHCEGSRLPGIGIYYIPDQEFVGTDSFSWYRQIAQEPTIRLNAIVTVRAQAADQAASSPS